MRTSSNTQRLLVSVRGPLEAQEAVKGGAYIIDAEYPVSALGTVYPINIKRIRSVTPKSRKVSTNIGEEQYIWTTSAQAALGVAFAGADIVKVGLARLTPQKATMAMKRVVDAVKFWFPEKMLIATFFADTDLRRYVDPIGQSQLIASKSGAHGVLIDTFDKTAGKGLLSYLNLAEVTKFVEECHKINLYAWIAGSITRRQMGKLWLTGVDVMCVRGAACEAGKGRTGKVVAHKVRELIRTIP